MIMNYLKKEEVSSYLWKDDSDMNMGNRNIWDRHLIVLFHQWIYRTHDRRNENTHHF